MNSRICLFLCSFLPALSFLPVTAQKLRKSDKAIIAHLSTHVTRLSDDNWAGETREAMAIEYICSQFKRTGIEPKGDAGGYLHSFEVAEGLEVGNDTHLFINGEEIKPDGYFPLQMSPSASIEASPSLSLQEAGEPWFFDLKEVLLGDDGTQQHIDLKSFLFSKAQEVKKKGCTALFIYNTCDFKDELRFDGNDVGKELALPVIYVDKAVAKKHFSDETAMLEIKLNVTIREKKHSGKYVVGFINNGAEKTIMIGTNETADNAAALIEIGNLLKSGNSKNNNYLLVAFFDKQASDSVPATNQHDTALQSPRQNLFINVSGTADTDKLNYIYTIVEKAK